jgi:preprotein translocase subunit SecE
MANKIVNYVKESYDELMNKVSWPSWSELQNSAVVVSIASLIIALVVFGIDFTLKNVIEQLYRIF